ncbi:septal ring lytic transglycosylase RlpA family protein [Azospirillum sp. sgz301742]
MPRALKSHHLTATAALALALASLPISVFGQEAPSRPGFAQTGKASWYGADFHGRKTASGVPFDQHALTAAHRTLPLGTEVKVTSLETGRAVVVLINDRGPFIDGRIIDLSKRAASELGMEDAGVAPVKVEALAKKDVQVAEQPDER